MYNLMNIFHISTATFTEGGPSFQIKIQVMGSVIEKALKRFYFQYPRSISDDYSCF